jgi:hypothetical protein
MSKILPKIKEEFLTVIPPTIFFFIAFNLLVITKSLILYEHGILFAGFANATIGALLVGKVVLAVDKFSFVNKFPDKPLIYNVAWKTTIYMLSAILVRYIEHLIPLLSKSGTFVEANLALWDKIVWPHFCVIHLWLSVLFLVFCAIRELARAIGREEFVRLFLGW